MATKMHVEVTCDLDHDTETPGVETIAFAVDGRAYEIDACQDDAKRFRALIVDEYAARARVIRDGRRPAARPAASVGSAGTSRDRSRDGRNKAIRAWAQANGHQISERGRIPEAIVKDYDADQLRREQAEKARQTTQPPAVAGDGSKPATPRRGGRKPKGADAGGA